MNNDNIYHQLKRSLREDDRTYAEEQAVNAALNEAVAKAVEEVKRKYAPVLGPLKKARQEANDKAWFLAKKYVNCGTFSAYHLVRYVAILMSFVEGERFVPVKLGSVGYTSVIVRENVALEFDQIDDEHLKRFIRNGDAVILERTMGSAISLVSLTGERNYDVGKYNYLQEFFNRLILYRSTLPEGPDEITHGQVVGFMGEFVKNHPELAERNRERRHHMISEYNDIITDGCIRLELSQKSINE